MRRSELSPHSRCAELDLLFAVSAIKNKFNFFTLDAALVVITKRNICKIDFTTFSGSF